MHLTAAATSLRVILWVVDPEDVVIPSSEGVFEIPVFAFVPAVVVAVGASR